VETIGSLGSADYVVVAGAAFLAYLLLPPAWSLLSFTLRGYKGSSTAHCELAIELRLLHALLRWMIAHFFFFWLR
jgi:hypothetical protein